MKKTLYKYTSTFHGFAIAHVCGGYAVRMLSHDGRPAGHRHEHPYPLGREERKKLKMKIQFFLPMANVPTVTHQEKKIDWKHKRVYEGEDLKRTRQLLTDSVAKYAPDHPMTGPVQLTVKWIWAKGGHKNGEYKVTRPDTDNLDKLLKDCMTATKFWKDDAQVVSEHIEKFWGDLSGIYIKTEEIEQWTKKTNS